MDEQKNQEQEFNLEDIIREFSDTEEVQQPQPEEPEEDVKPYDKEAIKEEQTAPQPTMVSGDTIRLEKIPEAQGVVRNAAPIEEEEPEMLQPQQPEEGTEPYSEQWEPEYEQPIAEYVPPQPITFRPRSRLRELKRKLVAGPEKQYYALSEIGLGKLQLAILASFLMVLLSAGATVHYLVSREVTRLMVFSQFWIMLVSALLGSFQLLQGITDLFKKKFSLNTFLVFTFVLCVVDGIVCLGQMRVPCCAAFSLQVLMSLWCSYQQRNTKLGQLDTMRKAVRLDSISAVEDYFEERKGFVRGEGQVEHFMDSYESTPKLQKVLSVYTLVALCVSVAIGVVGGILHGVSTGIQVASVACLAAMPASMFITISRPMAVLEKQLHKLGAVLCGWKGVEGLGGKAVFPVEHDDLFPVGTVQLNGVKFFGPRQPDLIIAYAAALMEADSNSLEPIFTQLLDSRNGRHYSVEKFQGYEGGIGGEINGEPVLAGTLSFLKDMGTDVPEGIRVSQAVCLAVDGELCGLFALSYEKDRGAAAGLGTLLGSRKLQSVLVADDFMLTPEFVRSTFGSSTKRMTYLDRDLAEQLRKREADPEAPALALVTAEGLAPVAHAISGARSVKAAATAGAVVHMVGGILGLLMMLTLAILGATQLLIPANLFLYELLWLVPGLLISEWPRTI